MVESKLNSLKTKKKKAAEKLKQDGAEYFSAEQNYLHLCKRGVEAF